MHICAMCIRWAAIEGAAAAAVVPDMKACGCAQLSSHAHHHRHLHHLPQSIRIHGRIQSFTFTGYFALALAQLVCGGLRIIQHLDPQTITTTTWMAMISELFVFAIPLYEMSCVNLQVVCNDLFIDFKFVLL